MKSFISSLKRRLFGCCDINGRMLKAYPLPFNTRCKQLHVAQASPFFNSKSSTFVWNLLLVLRFFYVAIMCVDILYVKVEINNEASALLWGWWLVYDKIKYLTKLLRQRAKNSEKYVSLYLKHDYLNPESNYIKVVRNLYSLHIGSHVVWSCNLFKINPWIWSL